MTRESTPNGVPEGEEDFGPFVREVEERHRDALRSQYESGEQGVEQRERDVFDKQGLELPRPMRNKSRLRKEMQDKGVIFPDERQQIRPQYAGNPDAQEEVDRNIKESATAQQDKSSLEKKEKKGVHIPVQNGWRHENRYTDRARGITVTQEGAQRGKKYTYDGAVIRRKEEQSTAPGCSMDELIAAGPNQMVYEDVLHDERPDEKEAGPVDGEVGSGTPSEAEEAASEEPKEAVPAPAAEEDSAFEKKVPNRRAEQLESDIQEARTRYVEEYARFAAERHSIKNIFGRMYSTFGFGGGINVEDFDESLKKAREKYLAARLYAEQQLLVRVDKDFQRQFTDEKMRERVRKRLQKEGEESTITDNDITFERDNLYVRALEKYRGIHLFNSRLAEQRHIHEAQAALWPQKEKGFAMRAFEWWGKQNKWARRTIGLGGVTAVMGTGVWALVGTSAAVTYSVRRLTSSVIGAFFGATVGQIWADAFERKEEAKRVQTEVATLKNKGVREAVRSQPDDPLAQIAAIETMRQEVEETARAAKKRQAGKALRVGLAGGTGAGLTTLLEPVGAMLDLAKPPASVTVDIPPHGAQQPETPVAPEQPNVVASGEPLSDSEKYAQMILDAADSDVLDGTAEFPTDGQYQNFDTILTEYKNLVLGEEPQAVRDDFGARVTTALTRLTPEELSKHGLTLKKDSIVPNGSEYVRLYFTREQLGLVDTSQASPPEVTPPPTSQPEASARPSEGPFPDTTPPDLKEVESALNTSSTEPGTNSHAALNRLLEEGGGVARRLDAPTTTMLHSHWGVVERIPLGEVFDNKEGITLTVDGTQYTLKPETENTIKMYALELRRLATTTGVILSDNTTIGDATQLLAEKVSVPEPVTPPTETPLLVGENAPVSEEVYSGKLEPAPDYINRWLYEHGKEFYAQFAGVRKSTLFPFLMTGAERFHDVEHWNELAPGVVLNQSLSGELATLQGVVDGLEKRAGPAVVQRLLKGPITTQEYLVRLLDATGKIDIDAAPVSVTPSPSAPEIGTASEQLLPQSEQAPFDVPRRKPETPEMPHSGKMSEHAPVPPERDWTQGLDGDLKRRLFTGSPFTGRALTEPEWNKLAPATIVDIQRPDAATHLGVSREAVESLRAKIDNLVRDVAKRDSTSRQHIAGSTLYQQGANMTIYDFATMLEGRREALVLQGRTPGAGGTIRSR